MKYTINLQIKHPGCIDRREIDYAIEGIFSELVDLEDGEEYDYERQFPTKNGDVEYFLFSVTRNNNLYLIEITSEEE